MTPLITNLEKLLASGKDTALLRFGLGNAYLDAGEAAPAAVHLRRATELKADYSAAWKLLGKALAATGDRPGAIAAYDQGIAVATQLGDKQAMKEMQVFRKRLEREGA
jgi:predicted Zn-dependent protease